MKNETINRAVKSMNRILIAITVTYIPLMMAMNSCADENDSILKVNRLMRDVGFERVYSTDPYRGKISSILRPYLESYERATGRNVSDVSLVFNSDMGDDAGYCTFYWTGERSIRISRGYWAVSDEDQRQFIIDHELVHCDLELIHHREGLMDFQWDTEGNTVQVAASILYPSTDRSMYYLINRDYYIAEIMGWDLPPLADPPVDYDTEGKEQDGN